MEVRDNSLAYAAGRVSRVRLATTAVVMSLAVLASGCGSGDQGDQPSGEGGQGGAAPAVLSVAQLKRLPDATTYGELSDAPKDPGGAITNTVLHPTRDLAVYGKVGGKPIARLPTRQIKSPTWAPVLTEKGKWAQILLPARPNGAAGWVYTGDGAAEMARNDFAVNINRAAFELEITKKGKSIGKWPIGIGKPQHPTPAGRAYIIASIKETVNDYSPIVLPLSFHSNTHETYGGGPGTVGIHTWPDESFVRRANSDGCIRVTKEALDALVKLPLGTIVNIT